MPGAVIDAHIPSILTAALRVALMCSVSSMRRPRVSREKSLARVGQPNHTCRPGRAQMQGLSVRRGCRPVRGQARRFWPGLVQLFPVCFRSCGP